MTRDADIRKEIDTTLLPLARTLDALVETLVRRANQLTVDFESSLTPGEEYDRDRAEDAGITALRDALVAIRRRVQAYEDSELTLQGLEEIRARGFTGVGITEPLLRR